MRDDDFSRLSPALTRVDVAVGDIVIPPDTPIKFAWFLESGICSMVAASPGGKQAEIGLIGRDGLVDTTIVHGSDRTPLTGIIQIAGSAWRVPADLLQRTQAASPALHTLLLNYAQSFYIQSASTALSYAAYEIPNRLARWLLMTQDRIGGDEVRLTHERFAMMLGVRRAGVTVAIQALQRVNLVEAGRGRIRIVDRERLRDYAGECYGAAEDEYARMMGFPIG